MKKKLIIGVLCVAVILAGLVWFMARRSLSFSTGPCIAAENGSYMIVMGNSPVVLHPRLDNETVFADLTTGDEIFVIHDGVQETYPGGTGLYFIRKLSDGDKNDVPAQVMEQLGEMGWMIE